MPILSGSLNITGSLIVNTITASFISGSITNAETASIATSSSYAATASIANTSSYAINSISASHASTASYLNPLNQDVSITGSMVISQNLTVIGTSSFTYVTSSIVQVGASTIQLNTDNPAVRFGGITVIDSGSFGTSSTGSLFWDSLNNRWIYANPSGSSYDGGMLMSGPRNTSGLGNEVGVTNNFLVVGQGADHISSSNIFHSASITQITGSLLVNSSGTGYDLSVGSNKLFVSASGDVGIGTSTPLAKLHAYGGSISTNISDVATTSTFRVDTANPAITAVIGYDGSDNVFLQSVNSFTNTIKPLLLNPYGGSIGIGTTTPTQKLTVATGSVTADNYYFNNIPNASTALHFTSTVSGISNTGYTTICNVIGDALSSGVRISLMGTISAQVINVVADILVNHSQDIYIESKSGIYTLLILRVISDNNSEYTIQAISNQPNPITLNIEVFPLNNELIIFNPVSTYAGSELIHH